MANKAYKFRLYPTQEQEQFFIKSFGCVRLVYNKMLAERNEMYEKLKSNPVKLKNRKFPTPAKYKHDFPFLKEVDSLALANAQINLQKAYKNFYDGHAHYPTFKSRKSKQSYTTNHVNGNIKLSEDHIKLPKLKPVKIKLHREIPSDHKIKSCTITRTKTGKYYISILTAYEKEMKPVEVTKVVGLDFAMNGLYVESEQGEKANYPRFYRQKLSKLAKEQRVLARRKKGSARFERQRLKVAKLQEKIANQRKNFLHHKSKELTTFYDAVVIEDLNMKGMSQAFRFGKSVHDNGWGMFTTFLDYKLKEQGKQLIKINRWYPSTKKCSSCGTVNDILLSNRIYYCSCGYTADRDHNAAINIKNEGIRLLEV